MFLKHLTSPKFLIYIRLRIPTPDVEAEIKVSDRKQVKFMCEFLTSSADPSLSYAFKYGAL